MRTWLAILAGAVLLGAVELWPFPQQDAGDLYIVETLAVEAQGGMVTLSCGPIRGAGRDMAAALERLRQETPGELFLRQTRRVIFCGGAESRCDPMALPEELPVGTILYRWGRGASSLDLSALSPVLEARERRQKQMPTLARVKNGALRGRRVPLAKLEAA